MSFLSVFDVVSPVINKVMDLIPDPQQKLEAQQQLMASLQAWDSQQTQINAVEAANSNIFVSGWRPAVGWCCALAFAYKFVLQPFMVFILIAGGSKFDIKLLPVLDWAEMSTVLFGLLGLGGLRSFEKIKGV